ncbi:trypsin beta-like [Episyrphus balteatus]|uniref:trypsin beta-like n=1 Tax=Episyrphus balteatus TaxID=286459 RepID=UPI002486C4AA|nr:trypsin beta-like [Episyrphus balteatus]
MFKLVVFISLVACALGSTIPEGLLPQLDGRIVGGEETTISEFPYQLSMMNRGSHSCGASLLTPRYALTAAHCVSGASASNLKIRAGSSSRSSGGTVVQVERVKAHPLYKSSTMMYDVAILKLESALPLGPDISTIELVKESPAEGTRAVVSGWGTKSSGALTIPTVLRFVSVKIVSREVCGSKSYSYGSDIKATMICAQASGKDACQGDSGGPLAVDAGQAGIVSWGYGCAAKNYPGVYTDVAAVRPWIIETILQL